MGTKTILLAFADLQASADISQVLGTGWMPTPVTTEADARAQLEKYPFDAMLVDFNFGSPDASELLNLALAQRPGTARFLMAYEADLALIAAQVSGVHHILPKPIELGSLKSRIEDGVTPEETNPQRSNEAAEAVAAAKIPPVYSEVIKALESPEVTNEQVATIIGQDPELTAEVLRLSTKTYLGLPRDLFDVTEAVPALGLEAVKVLVMALRFLAEHRHLKPGYLSLEKIWQHSVRVAVIARDLVLVETRDRALASQAFAAGLVHDLGKIVLVTNFDDLLTRALPPSLRNSRLHSWEVEKEMFGASHGEIGGCLLGMWNLPLAIVDAAALHHEPSTGETEEFTSMAAVHIANVLDHELRPDGEYRVTPIIDTRFLNGLGLLQRLPIWRAAFANGGQGHNFEAAPAQAATSRTASSTSDHAAAAVTPPEEQISEPITATRTATSARPLRASRSASSRTRWVYAGVTAALLLLAALWFGTHSPLKPSIPVYARTPLPSPTPAPAPANVPSTPSPAAVPTPVPQVAHETTGAPTASPAPAPVAATPVTPVTPPAPAPKPGPAPASAAPASITDAPPARMTEVPWPDFRLNGVIYGVSRPSAIVNGQTVYVGNHINGATVVAIGQNQITLELNGQRKTYALR